jgi:hypothetical protein
VTTAIDWNHWRSTYTDKTYPEHQAFYSEVFAHHPVQCHFNPMLADKAIRETNPTTVVELGGWDGELAELMLEKHPAIDRWTNVEICREARERGTHPRYEAPEVGDWYWTRTWTADLFVSSHAIEHLTAEDLDRTIQATDAQAIFLDAPLFDEPMDWENFPGTHILPLDWGGVDSILTNHGYALDWTVTHRTPDASGGQATARLYRRAT